MDAQGHEQRRRPRILLVDDTEINRDIIGVILSAADFDVDFACNGEAAYEAAWGTPYDLILMDVEMPGMNGFEAAARIRAREGVMKGVTIVALTATTKPDARHFSVWSGIDEFITRPIAPGVLVHRIEQIINSRQASGNDWKPVWRLGTFSKFTERLDEDETAGYLEEQTDLMTAAASAIDAGTSNTDDFSYTIHRLLGLSSRLGFEEVEGICKLYKDASSARNRDPNLLGAVNRALYAIKAHSKDKDPTVWPSLLTRAYTNVQGILRGKQSLSAVS